MLPYDEFLQVKEALRRLLVSMPAPDPRYGGFWDNLSTEELARRQGVKPVDRIEDLYGKGEPVDWEDFDEALAQWRTECPID